MMTESLEGSSELTMLQGGVAPGRSSSLRASRYSQGVAFSFSLSYSFLILFFFLRKCACFMGAFRLFYLSAWAVIAVKGCVVMATPLTIRK